MSDIVAISQKDKNTFSFSTKLLMNFPLSIKTFMKDNYKDSITDFTKFKVNLVFLFIIESILLIQ